ncbi:MAG: hypothetical protein RLZZ15_3179 [Verrucomicrobiota bacterium]|jgi:hypothetical protein
MAKAELTYSNITFNDITTGLFCTVGMVSINKNAGGQLLDDGGRITLSGTSIINHRAKNSGKGQIEITVSDASLTTNGFALIAKNAGASGDPGGRANFNSRNHNEAKRTITMDAQFASGAGAKWKILILVQNAQGQVGVIDPDVENEN